MKKLLIITCLLTFVSCETETVTLSKDEYNKLKGVKKSEYPQTI